jgi:nucleoside-diphosphate-sugar epimerase
MMDPGRDFSGTVLVTGSAGFIGSWVVEEFVSQGWRVVALVHRTKEARWQRHVRDGSVVSVQSDITDPKRFRSDLSLTLEKLGRGVDVVVHAAGRASDVGRRCAFRRLNLEGVKNVGQWALESGVGRLVQVSTTDVYGLRDFRGEAEEDLPLEMTVPNPYPEFKIEAERWVRERFPPDRYSILRPAAVWGPGDTTLTPRILGFLRWSPGLVHFGPWRGMNRWALANIRNVATAAFLCATLPEARGKAINVLDEEESSIDEFYRLLGQAYLPEKRFKTICLPLWLGRAMGRIVSVVSDALKLDQPFLDPSFYALHHVSSNLDFDNRRMRRLFATAGRAVVTQEEGVREMVDTP